MSATWAATMELRWHEVFTFPNRQGNRALQQKWQGSDGTHEWRDIPVVTEHHGLPETRRKINSGVDDLFGGT